MLKQLENLLAANRETLVREWARLMQESSASYGSRPVNELLETCGLAFNAYSSHIMEHGSGKLDDFIDYIVIKRVTAKFSISEVQHAFSLFRTITTPIILSELDAKQSLAAIEAIDRSVNHAIFSFSEKYQKTIDNEMLEINRTLTQTMQNLKKEKDTATRANLLKDQFLANISHELLTPLTSIIGYSKMMIGKMDINSISRDKFKVIYDQGKILQHHINTLILFSQINSGQAKRSNDSLDLKGLLEKCINEALGFLPLNNCKVNLVCQGVPHLITADGEKLRFAIYELIFNAIKFSHHDSCVDVICSYEPDIVRISVKDIGIGINTDNLETIFSPFFQVDGSLTRCYGGSGLGLAMIRKVAELHQGSIHVESTPGNGSRFTLEIPFIPARHH